MARAAAKLHLVRAALPLSAFAVLIQLAFCVVVILVIVIKLSRHGSAGQRIWWNDACKTHEGARATVGAPQVEWVHVEPVDYNG